MVGFLKATRLHKRSLGSDFSSPVPRGIPGPDHLRAVPVPGIDPVFKSGSFLRQKRGRSPGNLSHQISHLRAVGFIVNGYTVFPERLRGGRPDRTYKRFFHSLDETVGTPFSGRHLEKVGYLAGTCEQEAVLGPLGDGSYGVAQGTQVLRQRPPVDWNSSYVSPFFFKRSQEFLVGYAVFLNVHDLVFKRHLPLV